MVKEWIIFLILVFSCSSHGLVPLESILLGDFSEKYSKESKDPFDYLFLKKTELDGKMSKKRQLTIYRGYYEEGENLKKFCSKKQKISYPTLWQKDQVKRSTFATLQYIGLDISVRSISQYAKYFEFSSDEYNNLVENIVGNSCSRNLSIISIKQLKKNFLTRFKGENSFDLPSIEGNPLFPKKLATMVSKDDAKEREFLKTVEMFKTFCSWGGDTENTRLLVPYIKHPVVFSMLIRQISSELLEWNPEDRKVLKMKNQKSLQVLCEGLICRRVTKVKFKKRFPKSIGHKSLQNDLARLYCSELRDADYVVKGQAKKISKIIKSMTFDSENFLVGQFIALQTGIPDFFLRANNFKKASTFLRYNVDTTWDEWAYNQIDKFKGDVYYEEPLTLELVSRDLYYKNYESKFKVVFDVNLGEIDRANQMVGKVSSKFDIKFSFKFLKWARREWIQLDPRNKYRKESLFNKMKHRIKPSVERVRKKFPVPPWEGDLDVIIRNEILNQIADYEGSYFEDNDSGMVNIPIVINFAPYALKYLRYEYRVKENQRKSKEQDKLFRLKQVEVKSEL
jgi:hypothetical protein